METGLSTLEERRQPSGGMMEVAASREAQGVQAAFILAKKFPRDTNQAYARVMEDCKRISLAQKAEYSYPRGGQTVTGPSIRLAETIAKAYGNLDFGIVELERKNGMGGLPGESVLMSYCLDLETNVRAQKVFTVKHARDKNETINGRKQKVSIPLFDEREIYEVAANYAARRLRACILNILPADFVESAQEACRETIKKGGGMPLVDRIRLMVSAFQSIGVSKDMIESYLKHKVEETNGDELANLQSIYNSIKEGQASREDFFTFTAEVVPESKEVETPTTAAPKSVGSLKNSAPQTQEAALAKKKELELKEAQKVQESEAPTKQNLLNYVVALQKDLKWSPAQLTADVKKRTGKLIKDLNEDELEKLCIVYQEQLDHAQGGQNGN